MGNRSKKRIYQMIPLRKDGSIPRLQKFKINARETWESVVTRLLNEHEASVQPAQIKSISIHVDETPYSKGTKEIEVAIAQ